MVFSDFGVKEPDYNLLNKSETDLAIEDDLQEIRKYVSSGNYEALFYVELPPNEDRRKSIPPDLIFELSNVVARSDVVSINDYAFYMQKTGSDVLAVMLLEVIYREIPERTVTKLNLADGYWSLGYKAKACRIYGEYVREMNVAGKRNKIPKRAITRTDCLSS